MVRIPIDFQIDNPNLYRIAFASKTTGKTSAGDYCCSKEAAISMIGELNNTWPDTEHWIEANPRRN